MNAATESRGAGTDIVLATANAKYHHASLALRCLLANLGELKARAKFLEFTISDTPADQVERILRLQPKILGLSVYIWNVEVLTEVVCIAKLLAPELVIVLGGPEVSHELSGLRIVELADYVVQGEGEAALPALCAEFLAGHRPERKIIAGGLPDITKLEAPYALYTDEDLRQRTLYIEASRGCPYRCEFCLSSLDLQVRQFPVDALLDHMTTMIDRGARNFKFIDRTFNLQPAISTRILNFFLEKYQEGMLFHFELVPDRLPEALRSLVKQFPAGSLQFEVGVQTLNAEVGQRISRRQNVEKMVDNFAFIRDETHVHVHADLIVGLPGETLESFGAGLNRLHKMGPQEIQVGILKRLRGAPISRHDQEWGMVYSPTPPYEILRTSALDFPELQRLKRFAFVWDRLINRGNLKQTVAMLWAADGLPFYPVLAFSEALYAANGKVHAIGLDRLAEALANHLTLLGNPRDAVLNAITADYGETNRLLPNALKGSNAVKADRSYRHGQRQLRHV